MFDKRFVLFTTLLIAGTAQASPMRRALYWANQQDEDLRQAINVLITSGKFDSFYETITDGAPAAARARELRQNVEERAGVHAIRLQPPSSRMWQVDTSSFRFGNVTPIQRSNRYTIEVHLRLLDPNETYVDLKYVKCTLLVEISQDEKDAIVG